MLGDPVLDVAGLDRLPVPEDLEDGKQEAVPGRHLAHGLRAIAHARQAIRATENQRISVCSPFTGVSSRSSRPPSRDIRGPSPGRATPSHAPPHSRTRPSAPCLVGLAQPCRARTSCPLAARVPIEANPGSSAAQGRRCDRRGPVLLALSSTHQFGVDIASLNQFVS